MAVQIQQRGDTAAAWTAENPVLAEREIGWETDTRKCKIGNGSTAWNSLPYANTASASAEWGDITGTLSDQTDLQAALDGKAPGGVNVQTTASTATLTPTYSNDVAEVTAQAVALAIANPSGAAIDGHGIVIRIKDNGTARALTWGSDYRVIGVTLPTTTVVGKQHYIACIRNSAAGKMDVLAVGVEA